MGLAKLTIKPLNPSKLPEIRVLFNPNTYSITKTVTWSPPSPPLGKPRGTHRLVNAPTLTFGGGGSRQLNLELFFDVTEPVGVIDDVRRETDKIVALTRIERDHKQPPTCEVRWGDAPTGSDFPFIGVVTNLTQRFTLFNSDGKPLRATLTVAFLEFLAPKTDKQQTDPEKRHRQGGPERFTVAVEQRESLRQVGDHPDEGKVRPRGRIAPPHLARRWLLVIAFDARERHDLVRFATDVVDDADRLGYIEEEFEVELAAAATAECQRRRIH